MANIFKKSARFCKKPKNLMFLRTLIFPQPNFDILPANSFRCINCDWYIDGARFIGGWFVNKLIGASRYLQISRPILQCQCVRAENWLSVLGRSESGIFHWHMRAAAPLTTLHPRQPPCLVNFSWAERARQKERDKKEEKAVGGPLVLWRAA